jgi:hypothetical protein
MALTFHEEGVLSLRDYIGWEDNALSAIMTDGVAKWWEQNAKLYPIHFVERINRRLADPSSLPQTFPEKFSFWQRNEIPTPG